MKIREFHNHLSRINEEELPFLPPDFSQAQSLTNDEITDIILYAIPNSWKREIDKLGIDPDRLNTALFVDQLEMIEASEDHDKNSSEQKKTSSTSNKKPKKGGSKDGSKKETSGDKYCMYHKHNSTHTTEQCKVLKALAEAKAQKDGGRKSKKWVRKDSDKTKEEMKLLIQETAKEVFQNEMHAVSKKRKVIDDDKDEGKVNLSEFNYDKLEDLTLDDEASA